jgi:hypothetical protein
MQAKITKGNFSGYLEEEDNVDYFKFNVGAGNTINTTLVAPTNMKITATLFDSLNTERASVTLDSGGTRVISYLNSASAQIFYLKIEHDDYGSSPKPTYYTYNFELNIIGGDTQPPSAYIQPLPSNSCVNFTVNWNSPDPDTIKYIVQVRYGTNDWTDWQVNVTSKSATYHGTNNTRYFFRVKACDTWGNWGSFTSNPEGDASTNVTCEGNSGNTAPSQVTLNSPTKITSKGFTLSWTQSTDADFYSYEIHISTVSGFAPDQTTKKAEFLYSTTITYTITNLKSNTMYYAKIKVTDTDGLFSFSNEVYGKTQSENKTGSCCFSLLLLVGALPAILFLVWSSINKKQK